MAVGLLAKKCGMTRIFTPEGESIPVTVLEVDNNRVVQLKTLETDGYLAVQVGAGNKKATKVTKAMAGHFAKASVEPVSRLYEFRVTAEELTTFKVGDEIKVDRFETGQLIDVAGITKGKGFAGAIKKHHFKSQDATHGNSRSHRAPGSLGQNQSPGRVFKGKKMAGHLGDERRTIQSQPIVRVDAERNLILVRGAVPGAVGGNVIVMPAEKA